MADSPGHKAWLARRAIRRVNRKENERQHQEKVDSKRLQAELAASKKTNDEGAGAHNGQG